MTIDAPTTLTYGRDGRVARITLDRPERGNGITLEMPRELAACVEEANLDPEVHAIALSGNGSGFCGGYDLVGSAERMSEGFGRDAAPESSPLDPAVQAANHDPERVWDPVIDFQMMSRNVRGFMSLFWSDKPVLCKVHGYCVAGGTDMALCSDLLVIADDAKIGYPPARVWGVPTTAVWAHRIGPEKAKRLLFTGDCLSGAEAAEWGLATEAAPADRLDERFEALLERVARLPVNQLVIMKLLVNSTVAAQGLQTTQVLGTVFDGIARHTPEGYAFQRRAAEAGFKQAVRERDEPFGDFDVQGLGPGGDPAAADAKRSTRPALTYSPAVPEPNPNVTPDSIADRIKDSFPGDLGVEPLEVTDEAFIGRMVVDRRHLHPGGFVHGGAWVALADSVGAWQTFRHLPDGYDFTTVEMKLNVFGAAGAGDELIAAAVHLHAGRSTHVVEVRVKKGDHLVANLVITQFVLPPRTS